MELLPVSYIVKEGNNSNIIAPCYILYNEKI